MLDFAFHHHLSNRKALFFYQKNILSFEMCMIKVRRDRKKNWCGETMEKEGLEKGYNLFLQEEPS